MNDLHLLFQSEARDRLERVLRVHARRGHQQHVRLGALDPGQVPGKIRAPQRIGGAAHNRRPFLLGHPAEPRQQLLAPSVVGIEYPPALAQVLGHPARNGPGDNRRVQALMERKAAPVGLGRDLVGHRAGDEEHVGLLRLLVHGHLDVRREPAAHELHLVVFDELPGFLRTHPGIQLVVPDQQLDLLPEHSPLGVDLLDGQGRGARRVAGEHTEAAGQARDEPDFDRLPRLCRYMPIPGSGHYDAGSCRPQPLQKFSTTECLHRCSSFEN